MTLPTTSERRPGSPQAGGERNRRPPGPWFGRLLLAGLAAVAVAGFAVARPGPFRATVSSPAALARIAAIAGGFLLLSRVLRRFVANEWVRRTLVGVPVALLVALVVGPYFRDEEVVERLATSAAELSGDATPMTTTTAPSPSPTASPSATVATPATATTAPSAAASGPIEVSRGALRGIGHRASGTASIYRLPDSTAFVRLEGIDIENGPDYVLFLVPGKDRRAPGEGVSLGDLKANRGSQNYAIPEGTDLSGSFTVLVWCRAFSVPIAAATQESV